MKTKQIYNRMSGGLAQVLNDCERQYLMQLLMEKHSILETARIAGINRSTLYRRIAFLKIPRRRYVRD